MDMDLLIEKMEYYLSEYNMISKSPMNLVMFKFAIEHVSRVSRVLNQPNGNVLLVGIGGSGRHSAVKLASAMSEYNVFEVLKFKVYPRFYGKFRRLKCRGTMGCQIGEMI